MTEQPALPPVPPGRSALPAFLAVEAWMEERLAAARGAAEERLAAAREAARNLEAEGREKLRQAVIDGETEALREVESRAVDRVSDARARVEAWIGTCETHMDAIAAEAVDLLTRAPLRDPAAAVTAEAE